MTPRSTKSSSPASANPSKQSLEAKRDSTEITEVVTAEDIGKMPDKNVADSLARLPGITTSAAGANEGGFDENDRVSMRGTNPSLTQTLINGHNVAAGDWFVLDQVQHGRTQRQLHLAALGNRQQGGGGKEFQRLAGRRRRRRLGRHHHAQAARLFASRSPSKPRPARCTRICPSKTDGQYSALGNFKNDANNFGVMVQLFSETRHLRRDGVEILGYDTIAPGQRRSRSPHPDLSGVQYPTEIGAAFFTQKRERNGGMVDIEFKPTDDAHSGPVGLFIQADRQQLQSQLPVVVDALRQLRRRAKRRTPATWCRTTP